MRRLPNLLAAPMDAETPEDVSTLRPIGNVVVMPV